MNKIKTEFDYIILYKSITMVRKMYPFHENLMI